MAILPVTTIIEGDDHKLPVVGRGFVASQEAVDARTDRVKKEVDRLRSTHADYDRLAPRWRFFLRSYEGGPDYVGEDTLFKHTREHREDYEDRLERATYPNYCSGIIDFVPEYIFKDPIDRQPNADLKPEFDEFLADVDLQGTEFSRFMQGLAEEVRIFGKMFVLVDKQKLPEGVTADQLSQMDMQDRERLPYFVPIRPLEVLDWKTDSFGRYQYIKRVEYTSLEAAGGDWVEVERYSEWTSTRIKVTTLDVSDRQKPTVLTTEVMDNPWKLLPFVVIINRKSKSNAEQGLSSINDIGYQNRQVFNLNSLLDEFLFRQCVTGDTLIDGRPIKDLVGQEFQTTAWSVEHGSAVKRRAFDVRVTGRNQEVWRLEFGTSDEDKGHVDLTPDHPVLISNGQYAPVRDLRVGDWLVTVSGLVPFRSAEFKGYEDVYNMEVEDCHNYVANGVVVHNCFNVLAMEKDTAIPTRESTEGNVGTSNVLEVPRQASHFPQYISPPVDPAKFIQDERDNTIKEMYRQASQDVASELFAGSNRSGDAAKQSFFRSVPMIARLADTLQQAEIQLMTLWAKMLKKEWKGKIAYRDDYGVSNLQDLLLQLTTIFNSLHVLSPTFVREEWLRVIREFDGRLPHDTMEVIQQEIKDIPDERIATLFVKPSFGQSLPGMPTAAQAMQGQAQEALGSDQRISMATGNAAAMKESMPDRNKRTSSGSGMMHDQMHS